MGPDSGTQISRAPGRYVLAYGSGILALFTVVSLLTSLFLVSEYSLDESKTITCVQDNTVSGCYQIQGGWYYSYHCSYTDADGFYKSYTPLRKFVTYGSRSECESENYDHDVVLHVPEYTEELPERSFAYILTPLVFLLADVVFVVLWLLDTLKRASKNELGDIIAPAETRVPLITDYEMLHFDYLTPSSVLGNTMYRL